ncbi:MAG: hypothetical protein CM1200mP10_26450 [Candidatus Neomarinimicrobiota bacterium]|nr:MAG: hypothetical protein CM1200mP10_26450 [Candidatus Neomarinimicrobiota bacterium]
MNSFLAPFERVINFAIIKRDFNSDDELTQKGAYKRKQILKNFHEIINPMYEKNISLYHTIIIRSIFQIGPA